MPIPIELKRIGHYSPLRYPGGKAALTGFFDRVIKASELQNCTYAEPYAGGAGAALTLLFLERVDRIIINDLNTAVYSFWKTATQEADWLTSKIRTCELSVAEWRRQRETYISEPDRESKELGFAFFYLNRTSRSGILDGGPIGGLDQSGNYKIDARFNREGLIERIRRISRFASRISVTNEDGVGLADRLLADDQNFVYLDPPYYVKGSALYMNHFHHEHHDELARVLNRRADRNWLLTYDNEAEIRSLYEFRKQIEFSLNYSVHSSRRGEELMIPSDKLASIIR